MASFPEDTYGREIKMDFLRTFKDRKRTDYSEFSKKYK